MPILTGIVLLVQFSFAFHALKSGRPYWWVFIIMAFPVIGCTAYYFLEVFPGSREHLRAHRAARKIARVLQPGAELKRRAEELEVCGSVENKMALAQECINYNMFAEAEKLYDSCLSGPFQNDGTILFNLARTAVEGRNWTKAADAIMRLKAAAPKMRHHDVRLLEARVLEGRGQNEAALAVYRELIPAYVGSEALYRYAALLSRLGQHESARDIFNEVIKHSKRFAAATEDEQWWVDAARQAIAAAKPGK
jgi:hypothetical protein